MRTWTQGRTLVARGGLAIAALALVGWAADNLASRQKVASPAQVVSTASAAPTGEPACPVIASPRSLQLEDADGNEFKLVHVPGYGWKYVAGQISDGGESDVSVRKLVLSPVAAARATTPAARVEDPVAVFIDGPTGYTFAWTRDAGWTFVGHISDRNQ